MKTSRRSLFGFLGIAGAAAAVPALAAAQPAPRARRYINGKLICRCEAPEFDEVTTESVRYVTGYGPDDMGPADAGLIGSHTHTITPGDGTHTHTISQPARNPVFPPTRPVWRATITHHCIYCGGIEPEPVAA
jgi:hypothetical protein